jgi:hypothetical protein
VIEKTDSPKASFHVFRLWNQTHQSDSIAIFKASATCFTVMTFAKLRYLLWQGASDCWQGDFAPVNRETAAGTQPRN